MIDVVVVGGGVMGSAAAWQLASRGAEVVVLERFSPGHVRGSSHGSSRIVRLGYADPFYVRLAAKALTGWDRLEEETGERLLTVTGVVDHGDPQTVETLAATLLQEGHPVQRPNPAEAHERWPGIVFEGAVMVERRGGRVHGDRAVSAMQRAATRHGADVRHGVKVEAVVPAGDGAEVRSPDSALRARSVVVAAGAWTPTLVSGLPALTVTREQPAHFPPRAGVGEWPTFIHHQRGAATRTGVSPRGNYGLASPDGIKLGFHAVGPVVDPEHPPVVDARRLHELQAYAARWVPGVDAERPDPIPCLYTLTDSTDFVVDRAGPLVVATGFSGHGFKFAPEIGRMVADAVLGTGETPRRFGWDMKRRA